MTYFYIDPGTGSMLFTILVGVISAAIYGLKNFIIKIKFVWGSADKRNSNNKERIPVAILTDDKRYWNVFKPICDVFEKCGNKLVYCTASEDDEAFKEHYKNVEVRFTGEGNKSYIKWNNLEADVVLSTTPSLDVFQWKRSKNVAYYVHIPHAASDITIYRMFGIDYYDAIILSGQFQEEQIRQLEELRGLPEKEVKLLGLTHFDAMRERLNSVKNKEKKNDNRINVLLAPSWGASSIFNRYGGRIIEQLIASNFNLVIRPHPQSFTSEKEMIEDLMNRFPESDKLKWNRDNDNFNALNEADILISDFSGVLFDFTMVFNKPVIYADTSFDKAPYDAAWIDDELWTFKVLPKLGLQLSEDMLDDIKSVVEECLENKEFEKGRNSVRGQCWCNIGNSAEDIAAYLMSKQTEIRTTR